MVFKDYCGRIEKTAFFFQQRKGKYAPCWLDKPSFPRAHAQPRGVSDAVRRLLLGNFPFIRA